VLDFLTRNKLLLTDSYKFTHWKQLPPNTTELSSYFESRGGEYPYNVWMGAQAIAQNYFAGQFVTKDNIDEADDLTAQHFRQKGLFNRAGWTHILERYDGRLPLEIRAVKEGSKIPVHNVLTTVRNTDPLVPWLPNYIESTFTHVWSATTTATLAHAIKCDLKKHLLKTADDLSGLNYMLHDFGYRGASTVESAAFRGCGHLTSFHGTDNFPAIMMARHNYGAGMPAFSIPAAEHMTITSWGKHRELAAYRNLLTVYPEGHVSIVVDSYNTYDACFSDLGISLRDLIQNRKGTVVVRPDSGNPVNVVMAVLMILGERFGYSNNSKGYKVLPSYIRVIQGDGVNRKSINKILDRMAQSGWSADNIVFGMGGALLQEGTRDTHKFAFKACYGIIDSDGVNIFKQPFTDPGKNSKTGKMRLRKNPDGSYGTDCMTQYNYNLGLGNDELETMFLDGEMTRVQTLDEIRTLAEVE